MLSTDAVKQAFFARVAEGLLLIDEHGSERDVNAVTLAFGQAPMIDVAEWLAEHRAAQ